MGVMSILGVSLSGCNVSIIERMPVSIMYLLEGVFVRGCNMSIIERLLVSVCNVPIRRSVCEWV